MTKSFVRVVLSVFLAFAMVFTLAACGGNESKQPTSGSSPEVSNNEGPGGGKEGQKGPEGSNKGSKESPDFTKRTSISEGLKCSIKMGENKTQEPPSDDLKQNRENVLGSVIGGMLGTRGQGELVTQLKSKDWTDAQDMLKDIGIKANIAFNNRFPQLNMQSADAEAFNLYMADRQKQILDMNFRSNPELYTKPYRDYLLLTGLTFSDFAVLESKDYISIITYNAGAYGGDTVETFVFSKSDGHALTDKELLQFSKRADLLDALENFYAGWYQGRYTSLYDPSKAATYLQYTWMSLLSPDDQPRFNVDGGHAYLNQNGIWNFFLDEDEKLCMVSMQFTGDIADYNVANTRLIKGNEDGPGPVFVALSEDDLPECSYDPAGPTALFTAFADAYGVDPEKTEIIYTYLGSGEEALSRLQAIYDKAGLEVEYYNLYANQYFDKSENCCLVIPKRRNAFVSREYSYSSTGPTIVPLRVYEDDADSIRLGVVTRAVQYDIEIGLDGSMTAEQEGTVADITGSVEPVEVTKRLKKFIDDPYSWGMEPDYEAGLYYMENMLFADGRRMFPGVDMDREEPGHYSEWVSDMSDDYLDEVKEIYGARGLDVDPADNLKYPYVYFESEDAAAFNALMQERAVTAATMLNPAYNVNSEEHEESWMRALVKGGGIFSNYFVRESEDYLSIVLLECICTDPYQLQPSYYYKALAYVFEKETGRLLSDVDVLRHAESDDILDRLESYYTESDIAFSMDSVERADYMSSLWRSFYGLDFSYEDVYRENRGYWQFYLDEEGELRMLIVDRYPAAGPGISDNFDDKLVDISEKDLEEIPLTDYVENRIFLQAADWYDIEDEDVFIAYLGNGVSENTLLKLQGLLDKLGLLASRDTNMLLVDQFNEDSDLESIQYFAVIPRNLRAVVGYQKGDDVYIGNTGFVIFAAEIKDGDVGIVIKDREKQYVIEIDPADFTEGVRGSDAFFDATDVIEPAPYRSEDLDNTYGYYFPRG